MRCSILFACLISVGAWSDDQTPLDARPEGDFSHSTLLRRFDRDADGRLSSVERRELRDVFGGIDVPMLRPFRYVNSQLPSHLNVTELHGIDSSPENNPLTDSGATLGRVLFYDTQLSANNTIACASCHHQKHAFSDPRQLSTGFQGGLTKRNAMSLVNLRFTNVNGSRPGFFWDERAATLEDQALMPIQDKVEMGMQLSELQSKLQRLPYYPAMFKSAFGSQQVTSDRIAKSLAQFMRAMVSFDSRFDRAAAAAGDYSEDFVDFTVEENSGKSLFIDGVDGVAEIGCAHCHVPPTFGMPKAFNNGLDLKYVDPGLGARDRPTNDPFTPSNDGKFKAPSLRNVTLTGPYMHDGRFTTLREVIDHYSNGVHPHVNLGLALNDEATVGSKETSGFGLTNSQKSALIAFLNTLTDEKFISDPRFSDPFVRLED